MLSLYDYLGKAAGKDLGLQVERAARATNTPIERRLVSTATYQGKVNLYPRTFLNRYFKLEEQLSETTLLYSEPDTLPF